MATRQGKAKSQMDIINQRNRIIESLNNALDSEKITKEQWQSRMKTIMQKSGEYLTNIQKSQAGRQLQKRVDERWNKIDSSYNRSYKGRKDAAQRKEQDRLERGVLVRENNRDRANFENRKFVGYQGSNAKLALSAG